MKKLTLILLSILMIVTLVACGDKECKHIYDNACDITCNECGEERTVTHDFADANCTTPNTCTVCGATDGENKEHTPAEDDGDCATEVKCTVCGDVTTPAGQHTPNDDGNCLTAITCSVCGTTTTPAKESHTGGTATCTEKAVCTACGTAYGTIDVNNHIDENTDHICDRECGRQISVHTLTPPRIMTTFATTVAAQSLKIIRAAKQLVCTVSSARFAVLSMMLQKLPTITQAKITLIQITTTERTQ